jgi:hypothetical protein
MSDSVLNGSAEVDYGRRKFLTRATLALGVVGSGLAAVPFIESWLPSERARALGGPARKVSLSWIASSHDTSQSRVLRHCPGVTDAGPAVLIRAAQPRTASTLTGSPAPRSARRCRPICEFCKPDESWSAQLTSRARGLAWRAPGTAGIRADLMAWLSFAPERAECPDSPCRKGGQPDLYAIVILAVGQVPADQLFQVIITEPNSVPKINCSPSARDCTISAWSAVRRELITLL